MNINMLALEAGEYNHQTGTLKISGIDELGGTANVSLKVGSCEQFLIWLVAIMNEKLPLDGKAIVLPTNGIGFSTVPHPDGNYRLAIEHRQGDDLSVIFALPIGNSLHRVQAIEAHLGQVIEELKAVQAPNMQ